jgi:hypothetical protein
MKAETVQPRGPVCPYCSRIVYKNRLVGPKVGSEPLRRLRESIAAEWIVCGFCAPSHRCLGCGDDVSGWRIMCDTCLEVPETPPLPRWLLPR